MHRPDRRALAVLALCASLLASAGCVMSSTHDRVSRERDALLIAKRDLEEQVRLLRIANKSLDDHVAKLIGEREDLLETRAALQSDLSSTRTSAAALEQTLQSREEELAVTAAALVAQNEKVGELQGTYEGLVSDLEEEVAKGQIRVSQLREGLQVDVAQDILFPSGSARLNAEGTNVLKTVAARFRDSSYAIAVEGHSDNLPIRGPLAERYPSNWELAGARAASVVRLFAEAGIAGSRLSAVSHGDTQPVADNRTAEGRAQNRRIEILLRPLGEDDVVAPGKAGARKGS